MIIGVDEVGRGCWAGPVCVGAVVMHPSLEGIVDDSKKLSFGQRQIIAQLIKEITPVSLGWASPSYIDAHGLTAALKQAAKIAVAGIPDQAQADVILLDGNSNYIGDPRVQTIIKGDAIEPAIAAASIVAKVARDQYMQIMGERQFTGYGFESHVGYGTLQHRTALSILGPSKIHRYRWAPLKRMLDVD